MAHAVLDNNAGDAQKSCREGGCYHWMAGSLAIAKRAHFLGRHYVVPLYDLQVLTLTTLYAARMSLFHYCMREVNGILQTDDHSALTLWSSRL